MESGNHFVLVHGACLGGWCWYKLKPLLQAAGHRVTALDLGGCGVNPRRLDEIASLSDYLQPLMDFMASLEKEDRVVLVGHSYGGLGVSLAIERFPEKISVAVFITAYMPNYKDPPATLIQEFLKRTSMESVMDSRFAFDQGPENPPTSVIFGPEYTATIVYRHCQPEDHTPNAPFITNRVQTRENDSFDVIWYDTYKTRNIMADTGLLLCSPRSAAVVHHPPSVARMDGSDFTSASLHPNRSLSCVQDEIWAVHPSNGRLGWYTTVAVRGAAQQQQPQTHDKELAKMLLRPNGLFIEDLGQESMLTEARYGSVSRVFVVCEEDGVMGEEFQHWLIQNSPPKQVKSMAKAGHMVMLSKPKDLAFCLQNIVDEYH